MINAELAKSASKCVDIINQHLMPNLRHLTKNEQEHLTTYMQDKIYDMMLHILEHHSETPIE